MNLERGGGTGKQGGGPDRELSCFFTRELFSLYLEDCLDEARQNQVEKHLAKCAACSVAFKKIKASKDILLELGKTAPTPGLIDYLKKEQHFWTEFFEKAGWKNWPATVQWGAQLSLVGIVLVAIIHYFPWVNFVKRLNQMNAPVATVAAPATPDTAANTDAIEHPVTQQGALPQAGPPTGGQVAPAEPPKAVVKNDTVVKNDKVPYGPPIPENIRKALEATDKPVAAAKPIVEKPTEKTAGAENTENEGQQPAMQGFVWKGSLKVDSLSDEVTDRVTKTIQDLGGVKAGQVELGWHRGNQRYYHFILPEENYEKFLSALNAEGIVELSKQPHPRVIKAGHMRIIMTLEEGE